MDRNASPSAEKGGTDKPENNFVGQNDATVEDVETTPAKDSGFSSQLLRTTCPSLQQASTQLQNPLKNG